VSSAAAVRHTLARTIAERTGREGCIASEFLESRRSELIAARWEFVHSAAVSAPVDWVRTRKEDY
jgi:hypothetical protein